MIEPLRRAFNASWTESAYEAYKARLAEAAGSRIGFRLCESPVFLPPDLRDAMVQGALEIWDQLLQPAALERSKAAVPPEFDVPGSDDHPLFAQADFAIVEDHGRFVPRLIELQGFPSLYAFQLLQGRLCLEMMPGESLDYFLGGLDDAGYRRVVGDAILGAFPRKTSSSSTSTRPGRAPTRTSRPRRGSSRSAPCARPRCRRAGASCGTSVTGRRRASSASTTGSSWTSWSRRRSSCRSVSRRSWTSQWAGHPNWFFRWSKHALPGLRHPLVPESRLLSEMDRVPDDLERWVLKPLFSFSGSGVKVDVTPEDLAAVPESERASTLLMRKVDYAPVVEAADGGRSRVEVRVMFVWRDGRPLPVTTLARLSRGKMMGVKFNRDKTWVGSTSCLWPRA